MNNLFITGAGASVDFGMPIGAQLVEQIRKALYSEIDRERSPDSLIEICMRSGLPGDYSRAAKSLAAGLVSAKSIDRLLDSRIDDELIVKIGKVSIAYCLLKSEAESILCASPDGPWHDINHAMVGATNTWIGRLFAKLHQGVRPRQSHTIFENYKFITFNYDRTIERFLYLALRHIMDNNHDEALGILQNIEIEHVYGSLGTLWGGDGTNMPYASSATKALKSSGTIRTFTEGCEEGKISKLRQIINNSDRIFITGFGFDDLNVHALFEKPLPHEVIIVASCLGFPNGVPGEVKERIGGQWVSGVHANSMQFVTEDHVSRWLTRT